jgi:hypothetical protein
VVVKEVSIIDVGYYSDISNSYIFWGSKIMDNSCCDVGEFIGRYTTVVNSGILLMMGWARVKG